MSGADEEEWVKSAMTDDTMVVDLLVRLHQSAPPPLFPVLEWSVRQRRSKSLSLKNNNKNMTAHRGSPTTVLSWSGGGATSVSGISGFEDSSRPPLPNKPPRSKQVNGDSERTASKRSRKKKTLVELKEEENMLVKERKELNKNIAALRRNLEKQRATNESFKKMKLELQPEMNRETASLPEGSISYQFQRQITAGQATASIRPPIVSGDVITLHPSASNGTSNPIFSLPDLNIPFEDSVCDAMCGVS